MNILARLIEKKKVLFKFDKLLVNRNSWAFLLGLSLFSF